MIAGRTSPWVKIASLRTGRTRLSATMGLLSLMCFRGTSELSDSFQLAYGKRTGGLTCDRLCGGGNVSCANGLYCDTPTLKCMRDKKVGEACAANKEYVAFFSFAQLMKPRKSGADEPSRCCRCESYYCMDGKCHKAAGDPSRPASWVYAIVAICIALRKCRSSLRWDTRG